jgi:ectoine hydroxylase-related dioxygenase (phytanoyl-CoA dioxygenase family)
MMVEQQRQRYQEQGYLLVSGLIPEEVAAAAEEAMWRLLHISPSDPSAWTAVQRGHHVFDSSELLACFTPAYLATAAALAGDDPRTFRPPSRAYCINIFPREGAWEWPRPHIDHAIKEHAYKVFPRAFRIASMVFLHDVAPHGGGTVVWPGSHRRIEALARSDPERYELMWPLNQDLQKAGLGDPLELTPKRGDVLFYHYLCAHAGSANVSDRPRFAMNMKW